MSDDPDFPKVNHALQVLRQARLSRNEAAAIMLADLVYEMAGAGLRTPEIGQPVQFEIMEQTRVSLETWLRTIRTTGCRYLFPSRLHARPHLSTRQHARLVHRWVDSIGLDSVSYGTHSMRRTKVRFSVLLRASFGVEYIAAHHSATIVISNPR
jgi:hypothetical protein